VTGSKAGPGAWDFYTIKYDANGNKLWEATYDSPVSGVDLGSDIALGPDGSVYVTGALSSISVESVVAGVPGHGIPQLCICSAASRKQPKTCSLWSASRQPGKRLR